MKCPVERHLTRMMFHLIRRFDDGALLSPWPCSEIVIRDSNLDGVASGGVAKLVSGGKVTDDAEEGWNSPLNFHGLGGDGPQNHRRIFPVPERG